MKLINMKSEELLIDKNTLEPIIIVYDLKKENKNSRKIKIKKDIKASIIEVFTGNDTTAEFEREFIIEENAKLEYLKLQDFGEKALVDFNYKIQPYENSKINIINLDYGVGTTKSFIETNLDYENIKFIVNGLVKINKQSNSKSVFKTVHNAANSLSDIAYKHILDEKAKAVFEAKSIVYEKALNSKVFQNSQTLLLSEDAIIFNQPHLEIHIDELEAAHGATTGSLDEEQLLYLQARGISKQKAVQMLLKAFENKVYDKIIDIKIKEFLENYKRN